MGRQCRSESDEVNLQTELPKDTASELEHNIRFEGDVSHDVVGLELRNEMGLEWNAQLVPARK